MLIAKDLSCVRGERLLFSKVSLTLATGGLCYVQGENGSGKTSLLRMLCGLLMPAAGEVLWQGNDIRKTAPDYLQHLLYLGHLNGLKDDLTALENLLASAALAGEPVSEVQALSALAAIGIERCAMLPVGVLSQGQKRRLALARLWLSNRQLWVLDEPYSALDTASSQILTERLNLHLAQGGMAVITTHQALAITAASTQTLRLGA